MSAEYSVITVAEAEERFSISSRIAYPYQSFADRQEIRLYQGPVAVDGDFTTSPDAEWSPYNAIIDGDLTVSGDIDWSDFGAGNFLVVTGSVRARNLFAHGCPNVFIGGSLTVEHGVQGHHGDDGGVLAVVGEVTAEVIVNTLYFSMDLRGEVHGPLIGDPYRTSRPVDFDDEEADEVLIAAALEPEGGIDEAKVTALLKEGRRILRPGVKPAHVVVAERLAALREAPDEVTDLDLSSSKLRSVPDDLGAFPNLRVLVLSHNPIRELPASIGSLTGLEELYLDSTDLETLPAELGELSGLKVLDLSSSALEELPAALGRLSSLEVLRLGRLDCPLPDALGELTGLEELDLSHHRADEQPVPFPEQVLSLSSLVSLDLTGTSVRGFPDGFAKLSKLHTLRLSGAIGVLDALPDLSALTALTTLELSGNRVLVYTPYPRHDLIEGVWRATSLQHLSLDRWGAQSDYNVDAGQHEPVRGDLESLPEALGQLTELRTLNLSFNGLTGLPDAFFGLRSLERVDLRYNPLSPETLDRIAETFPDVEFDLRHVAARDDSPDDPNWQKVRALVEQGAQAWREGVGEAGPVIDSYRQALALCTQGARYSHHDQLRALCGLVDALDKQAKAADGAARREALDELAGHARKALTLVPDEPDQIVHLTDEGAFQKGVILRAGDALARYLSETADGEPALLEALNLAECAAVCVTGPADHDVFDTQVRILLKLGRDREAYRIVERVLATNPGFAPFADIQGSDGYREWRGDPA